MKRILIAAVVAAFAVAGCSKEEPAKGPGTPTPQVTPPAPATADAGKDEVRK